MVSLPPCCQSIYKIYLSCQSVYISKLQKFHYGDHFAYQVIKIIETESYYQNKMLIISFIFKKWTSQQLCKGKTTGQRLCANVKFLYFHTCSVLAEILWCLTLSKPGMISPICASNVSLGNSSNTWKKANTASQCRAQWFLMLVGNQLEKLHLGNI